MISFNYFSVRLLGNHFLSKPQRLLAWFDFGKFAHQFIKWEPAQLFGFEFVKPSPINTAMIHQGFGFHTV